MISVSFLITGSTEPVKASYKRAAGEGRGGDGPRWGGLATMLGRATGPLLGRYWFYSLAQTSSSN